MGTFHFIILTSLRAAQLMRGCRPRVNGDHKAIVIAQLEVAEGKIAQIGTVGAVGDQHDEAKDRTLEPLPAMTAHTSDAAE